MIIKFRLHTLLLAVALFAGLCANGANTVIKASLDSAYLLMGKQTLLHVSVVGNLPDSCNVQVVDTAWRDVEIIGISEPTYKDLGNNRKELLQDVIVQSFDSGMYTLPPIYFIDGGETIASNRPVLKVLPVAVDSMITVHDYADVVDIKRHFLDYLPDWLSDYGIWILLALVIIGGAGFVYFKWLRKGKLPLMPVKKPVPPYQLAMQQLQTLHDEHLCEKGEEKEFYTRLTDILRTYLDARFGINAMEMTSGEILDLIRKNSEAQSVYDNLRQILQLADFVKFAKMNPLPDENDLSMMNAYLFVNQTKVEEMQEPESTNDTTNLKD